MSEQPRPFGLMGIARAELARAHETIRELRAKARDVVA